MTALEQHLWDVRRHVLPNGLTVLIQVNHAAPVAAVNTYVRAGYFDETDDVVGVAHVLEHMFFKGTARFGPGEIARATKAAGGYLNAHTIYDHTSYYVVVPSAGLTEAITIQSDAYARSVIDAGELARELEVIIQEANRKADNPAAVVSESLYAQLFDVHRMRRWRIGTEAGLRSLRRDDVAEFYRNFYTPCNTILAIAGDVDPDATLELVTELYGVLPVFAPQANPGPAEPEHEGFRYRALSGDVTQTTTELGWRTVPLAHPDTPALDLAAAILGAGRASRLYRAVRDGRLAGAVGATHYTPGDVGVFAVSSEGDPATAGAAARAMWAQVAVLRAGDLAEAEVERAQRLADARLARRLETMEGQAAYLVEWEANGGWEAGTRYHTRLATLTAADVTHAVQRHLAPERAALVEYHPAHSAPMGPAAAAVRDMLDAPGTEPLVPSVRVALSALTRGAGEAVLQGVEGRVRVYRSASGLPILVRHKPGAVITHMGVFAGAGAADEPPAHAGITALAARAAARQTVTRTALQIAEAAELLGGSVAASAGAETFAWSISVPAPNAGEALVLLADVVQHATLPDAAIETERRALLVDAAALRDDMYRYPMRLVQRAAFGDHPYATPAGGDEATLERLTPPLVREWHATAMRSAPFVAAVVGDWDPDTAANAVAAALGELTPGAARARTAPRWPDAVRVSEIERLKAQTALAVAFAAPGRHDDRRFAAHVLATIASGLGGRFFDELRDRRSLAYTVHTFATELRAAGLFVTYIATSPASEEAAREGILQEFEKLRACAVTAEELARAKRYLLGMHDVRQERGAAILGDMVDAWLSGTGLGELDAVPERIAAVSADAIQALVRDCFDPARRVEGIVRGVGVSAMAEAVLA